MPDSYYNADNEKHYRSGRGGGASVGDPFISTIELEGLAAAAALSDALANPTTIMVGGAMMALNGTTWERVKSTAGALHVALPTGAATETTLAGVLKEATFTDRVPAKGQAAMAGSVPVVIASNQSAVPVSGTVSVTLPGSLTGYAEDSAHASGHVGLMPLAVRRDAASTMVSADGDYSPLQVDAQGALRVSGTFWQTTQPVSIASVPSHHVTNAGVFAVQAVCTNAGVFAVQANQSGTWTVELSAVDNAVLDDIASKLGGTLSVSGSVSASVSGTVAISSSELPTGAATLAEQQAQSTLVGAVNETAPSGDTDSSGLNGRLQRIAQRLTSLITLIPEALTSGGGFKAGLVDALPAGTNNIGDVDVLTQPARARTTDTIAAALATDALMDGTTALTPKRFSFSSASAGNQAMVAAVTDKKIRLLSLQVIAVASTNAVYINDGTANLYGDSTRKIPLDISGATGPGGFTLPFNPLGWLETADVTRPLNLNLGSASGVLAVGSYVEI